MEQAKINVKDNEDYKKANEILKRVKEANVKKPMAPNKWVAKQYAGKGTTLFISSLLATFAISQAVLTYKWMHLLSYILVITMSIIFGILQMKKAEIYWTFEYYQYALDYEEKYNEMIAKEKEQTKIEEESNNKENIDDVSI